MANVCGVFALVGLLLYITPGTGTEVSERQAGFGNRKVCLSCERVADPHDCLRRIDCEEYEACFTEQYITTGGHVFFDLGCLPTSICNAGGFFVNSTQRGQPLNPVGRHVKREGEFHTCEECCMTDLCNQRQCGAKEPNVSKCLSCSNIRDPNNCDKFEVCAPNEVCFIQEKLTDFFELVYDMGCIRNAVCEVVYDNLNPGLGNVLCTNCCNNTLCNAKCTPVVPTTTPAGSPTTTIDPTLAPLYKELCATQAPGVVIPSPKVFQSTLTQLGCGDPEDIIFVSDITERDRDMLEAFVDAYVLSLDLGPNKTRVAYIDYGENTRDVIDLQDGDNMTWVDTVLRNHHAQAGRHEKSRLDETLEYVHQKYFDPTPRPEARQVVVVLAESDPEDPANATDAAQKLKDAGAEIVVVALGQNLDDRLWTNIASSPESKNLLHVANLKELGTDLEDLVLTKCLDASVPPTFPPSYCVGPKLVEYLGCGAEEDILVILDRSGSIRRDEWPKMINFTVELVNSFDISPNASRMGVLSFSRDLKEHIHWAQFSDKSELALGIEEELSKYRPGGDTYTNLALDKARELFRESDRPEAVKVVIIMTDGGSDTKLKTLAAAERNHNDGIKTFVIGMGTEIDLKEQAIIASDPDNLYMLNVVDQGALLTYLDVLAAKHCQELASRTTTAASV